MLKYFPNIKMHCKDSWQLFHHLILGLVLEIAATWFALEQKTISWCSLYIWYFMVDLVLGYISKVSLCWSTLPPVVPGKLPQNCICHHFSLSCMKNYYQHFVISVILFHQTLSKWRFSHLILCFFSVQYAGGHGRKSCLWYHQEYFKDFCLSYCTIYNELSKGKLFDAI